MTQCRRSHNIGEIPWRFLRVCCYVVMYKATTRLRDQHEPTWCSILACVLLAKLLFWLLISLSTASSLHTASGIVCECVVSSSSSPPFKLTVVNSTHVMIFRICYLLFCPKSHYSVLACSFKRCVSFGNWISSVANSLFWFFNLTMRFDVSFCLIA